MGAPPAELPHEDPLGAAIWAETAAGVVLEQAEEALSGGDLPRALALAGDLLRRPALSLREQAGAWDLLLGAAASAGDPASAREAVTELASWLPAEEVRDRIRTACRTAGADPELERALLTQAGALPPQAPPTSGGDEPGAALLAWREPVSTAGRESSPPEHREDANARARELVARPFVAAPAREHLLSRHPAGEGHAPLARELRGGYDLGVELFGQAAWEEAARVLLPPATTPSSERCGALELLARALLALDRTAEAEAYLLGGIPEARALREAAHAPLLLWLGRIAERQGDVPCAAERYAAALALGMPEARAHLQALLGL